MDSYIDHTFKNPKDIKDILKKAVEYFLYHPEKNNYDILAKYFFYTYEHNITIPYDAPSNEKLCIIYAYILNQQHNMNELVQDYLKNIKDKMTYTQEVFLTILIYVILSKHRDRVYNYVRFYNDIDITKIRIQKEALKHALIDEKSTFKTLTQNSLYDINLGSLISSMISHPCKILSIAKIRHQDEKIYDTNTVITERHVIVENSEIEFKFDTNHDILTFLNTSLRYLFKIKLKDKIKYVTFGYNSKNRIIHIFLPSGELGFALQLDVDHYFPNITAILIAIRNKLKELDS